MLPGAARNLPASQLSQHADESWIEYFFAGTHCVILLDSSETTKQPITCWLFQNECLPSSTVLVDLFKDLVEASDVSFPQIPCLLQPFQGVWQSTGLLPRFDIENELSLVG